MTLLHYEITLKDQDDAILQYGNNHLSKRKKIAFSVTSST